MLYCLINIGTLISPEKQEYFPLAFTVYWPGQLICWHCWLSESDPVQLFPPYWGAGLVQVLVLAWVPFPQATEQEVQGPHPLQPPCTSKKNNTLWTFQKAHETVPLLLLFSMYHIALKVSSKHSDTCILDQTFVWITAVPRWKWCHLLTCNSRKFFMQYFSTWAVEGCTVLLAGARPYTVISSIERTWVVAKSAPDLGSTSTCHRAEAPGPPCTPTSMSCRISGTFVWWVCCE